MIVDRDDKGLIPEPSWLDFCNSKLSAGITHDVQVTYHLRRMQQPVVPFRLRHPGSSRRNSTNENQRILAWHWDDPEFLA